jgi:signal transduction histidine kinase
VIDGGAPPTLFAVLKHRRQAVVEFWGQKIRDAITGATLPRGELLDRIPAFVVEIVAALNPDAVPLPTASDNAEEHGAQRLRLGFDVGEVVREYGLLHEAILDVARAEGYTPNVQEQAIVAKWLNAGIAEAVAQYVKQRDVELQRQASEHLGFIAHELRNPITAALLAFQRLKEKGQVQAAGRAYEQLERGLRRTREMIDTTLEHASMKLGIEPKLARLHVLTLLVEVELDAASEAQARQVQTVISAPGDLQIQADASLLKSAIANLLHNGIKFSAPGTSVAITARREEGHVTIEVADSCGGLPPGRVEELFAPLVQRGENRSGFGLGLSIAMHAVQAHGGTIEVRDIPGTGCVFSIRLPQAGGAAV